MNLRLPRAHHALPAFALVAIALGCASPDSPHPDYPTVSRREAKACRREAKIEGDIAHDAVMRGVPYTRVRGTGSRASDDAASVGVTSVLVIARVAPANRERDRVTKETYAECIDRTSERRAAAVDRTAAPAPP